ncbi:MAG: 50S ribosomal protein L3 [Parcubacteria group bacterium GW2011_GWF2_39_13b]|nr:MAG: 50S ribosomal protein L3 [Parcubacteria group bacterium GW2011_GWF2_39_13b]
MAKFILGKKLGMSQLFDKDGKSVPVTVIEAGPCYITQIKTKNEGGYEAAQVGFGKSKNNKKPKKGHFKKSNSQEDLKWLKEFRIENNEDSKFEAGQEIKADIFQEGDLVKVSGISKGKGFAGVVKRHGFRGAPASHGTKHNLRAPGSIGSTFPEHVLKGKKMAGRMGSDRVSVKNLEIVSVDVENNLIAVRGAVPGNNGSLVEIIKK